MAKMWATVLKNLEVGKMELVAPDLKPRDDDPKYDRDVHILPCTPEDIKSNWDYNFGYHEFTRECCCHPKVRYQDCGGRTLVIHKEKVN